MNLLAEATHLKTSRISIRRYLLSCFIALTVVSLLAAFGAINVAQAEKPDTVISGPFYPNSVKVDPKDLKPVQPQIMKQVPEGEPLPAFPPPPKKHENDPVIQLETEAAGIGEAPGIDSLMLPFLNFGGMNASANPPDTVGDVGRNHYVQMVNATTFQIWDKLGNSLLAPLSFGNLWPGGDICMSNAGDPIVVYDHLADRWLLSQFADPNHMCFAISQTPDPTAGTWYLYTINVSTFPDYPKIGVWPDGYYMSSYEGANLGIFVFDRAAMLSGTATSFIKTTIGSLGTATVRDTRILPADLDGPPPPAGTPNYFVRTVDDQQDAGDSTDRIEVYSASVDWLSPSFTFTLVDTLPPAPFNIMTCDRNGTSPTGAWYRDCIPQPGTTATVDALSNRPMMQLKFRNFDGDLRMVFNQTIDVSGSIPNSLNITPSNEVAGIRWYELKKTGANWTINQQGTYAPQPINATAENQLLHRWMGSMAMDWNGNIALGYSIVNDNDSSPVYPGIRYTGRLSDDVPGLLPQGEKNILTGTVSKGADGSYGERWGDYSALSVDPVDDCTFWYTTHVAGGGLPSRIASFRFDNCSFGADLAIWKSDSPDPVVAGEQLTYTVTVHNYGPLDATNVEVVDTLPAGVTYVTSTDSCLEAPAGTLTCTLGTVAVDETISFQIVVDVNSNAAGTNGSSSITNTATVSADEEDPGPDNNTATAITVVKESADLLITKQCKPDGPVVVGQNGTCTIFVDNLGPSDATNVVVTDTHLSNGAFSISSANASPDGACIIASGIVTCNLGTEPAGGRTTITVIVTSPDSVDVNDTATVKSDTPDPDKNNNIATGKVSFFTGATDVVVTKTCKPLLAEGPYYIGSGANLPYCDITVTNYGPDPATNLVLTDRMIATGNFSIDSISPVGVTCTLGGSGPFTEKTITCDPVATLAKNASISLRVIYSATRSVDINDTATVTTNSQDANPANNIASGQVKLVEQADLSVTKVCKPDGSQVAGGTTTCEIVVTNNGQSSARAVQLVDTLTSAGPFPFTVSSVTTTAGTCPTPASTPDTVSASPYQIICNLGDLAVGSAATVKIGVTSNNQVDINDVATAASPTPDPNTANNTATGGVHFVALADLGLIKSAPASVTAGNQMTYTLAVTNYGPSPAVNVVVKDIVPFGVDIVSVSGSGGAACNAGTPGDATKPTTCQFNTIAVTDSRTMTIIVNVLPGTRGILHNDASVSAATLDTNNVNDIAGTNTTVETSADIVVLKTRTSAGDVVAGAQITYQVIVRNDGPSTATGVVLTDTLPSEVDFISSSPACIENPIGTLICALGTFLPYEAKTVYITVKVDPATPAGITIDNTATAGGNEIDPNTNNNTSNTSDESTTSADLWIDKVSNFPTGNPSGTIVYDLYVYNKPGCELKSGTGNVDPADCWNSAGGPSDAQDVVVTDTLPLDPKTFVVQYVSPNCTYYPTPAPHRVVCNVADTDWNPIPLPAGAVAGPFQIQAVVKGSKGTFPNSATVTSITPDPYAANNTDLVKTTVQGSTGKRGGGR